MNDHLPVIRRPESLLSDDKRVITRYLDFGRGRRVRSIVRRLMKLPERQVRPLLDRVCADFSARHRDMEEAFRASFDQAAHHCRGLEDISPARRRLIGAYFTCEYSIESAALFNPSIVPHPEQGDVPRGSVRFLMSLRATGEGHVSSIVFRRGVIGPGGKITFDPPPRYAFTARPVPDRLFEKRLFERKLWERGADSDIVRDVLQDMPDAFSARQLEHALARHKARPNLPAAFRNVRSQMLWLVHANYTLQFPPDSHPAETVIFPATAHERNGMEDVRLVRFEGDDGQVTYYGTYTAFDGRRTHPMLLETPDFRTFHVSVLVGRYAKNKGMALFPRKVDGKYLMVSRHDGENLFLLRSQDLHVWNNATRLQTPREDWELVQIGNCGSPLETDDGWILLTHGVGPLRQYCIGVSLLDRNDPSKVIGRLREPLLVPNADEREGYVPNVVYSCGSMIHRGTLVIPYAMSDSRTAFAEVKVSELLDRLKASTRKKRRTA